MDERFVASVDRRVQHTSCIRTHYTRTHRHIYIYIYICKGSNLCRSEKTTARGSCVFDFSASCWRTVSHGQGRRPSRSSTRLALKRPERTKGGP